MKNEEYVWSVRLILLVVVNTALDYAAICEFYDVDPFTSELSLGNLISLFVSLGLAMVLSVFAQRAATARVEGKSIISAALLGACVFTSIVVAAFRAVSESTSAGTGIAGSSSGVLPSDLLFAAMLCLMLVGEAWVAYADRISAYQQEADYLVAALERIRIDLKSIDRQVEAAAREANERMLEAMNRVYAADEAILEEALRHAGEMQSAFVGYAAEAEKVRMEHSPVLAKRIEGLLIPVVDGAAVSVSQADDTSRP